MLLKLAIRTLRTVSPRLLYKAANLWVRKGRVAMSAYRKRLKRGELFPPFLFLALTSDCNLACQGCWIHGSDEQRQLSLEQIERIIAAGKKQKCFFYTLLGGEPYLYPHLWTIIENHPDCYFQIITNGMFHDDASVEKLRQMGNVTILLSLDGLQDTNDARRGEGVFEELLKGAERLKKNKLLFGVATTVTAANFDQVVSDAYVEKIIATGAMYLWFYVYRPVGADPSPQLALEKEKLLTLRREILRLRRKHPIILIDTYWDAKGEAVCPAARGLGFHIGPGGAIEPCPPISLAAQNIDDGELFETITGSDYLRDFQTFVDERTKGCVILEKPQELLEFAQQHGAKDSSGRDIAAELTAAEPRSSHHLPGEEIPEDFWFYKLLKKMLFFGMGGYG